MKKFLIFCCLVLVFNPTEADAKGKNPIGSIVKTIIKFPTESAKMVKSLIKLTKDIMSTRKAAAKKITPKTLVELDVKMEKIVEDATKLAESLHNHVIIKEVEKIVKMCGSPVVTMVAATPMGGGLGVVCARMSAVQAILGRYLDKADNLSLAAISGKENISNKLQAAAALDPAAAAAAAPAETPP